MLVFRSFAIGLSAACFALLVMRPSVVVIRDQPSPEQVVVRDAEPSAPPTIVDVAPGITPEQLALALRLAPNEFIVYADDVVVPASSGYAFAARALHSGQFLDLVVRGPTRDRRVLVLMH